MRGKSKMWTPSVSMSFLAFAVYCKEQGHDFLDKVPKHLEPLVGKMVTDGSVLAQLSRLAITLKTSTGRLKQGEIEAINAAYLTSEERMFLEDALGKLFRRGAPRLMSWQPDEPLEGSQNAQSDTIMVDDSTKLAARSTIASPELEPPAFRKTKRIRTSPRVFDSLPIQQPHIQEPSLQAQSVVLHDADKVALQREITSLREEKRILEQRSTQAQTRNDELHEQLVGLNNDHDRVESELAATRRRMEQLKQILVQQGYNKGHEQGDTMVEHVQFTVSIQDASRVNELYDDLLSYMGLSRNGSKVLASINPEEVKKEWQLCQARLRSLSSGNLWGRGAINPETIAPGFASFLSKLYGRTKKVSIHEPTLCLPLIENPNKRTILKAYAMDNLCERVFQRSDFHDFDKTKCRMLEKYRLLIAATTGGFQALQTLDAAAMKALLSESDGYLRHKIVEEEANKIAQRVDADLTHFFVDGPSTEGVSTRQTMFRQCASVLLALKFELLLADKEYEIHFVEAGSQFDPGTMNAVSDDDTAVEGGPQSTVQFCVYPALLQYDSSAVSNAKDFSAVLLCNKSFYPGNLPRRNALVVAKATVMLV